MTVSELMEYLSDFPNDAQIFFAYQPNYPLFCQVSDSFAYDEARNELYLSESQGGGTDYLSQELSDELEW